MAGFPHSALLLDFVYLKVSGLKAFIFVYLTGSNEMRQKLPQNKKWTMNLEVEKVRLA
jgi:hypothetical protein